MSEQYDLGPPPPKITRYQDAISSLKDVRAFLDSKEAATQASMNYYDVIIIIATIVSVVRVCVQYTKLAL